MTTTALPSAGWEAYAADELIVMSTLGHDSVRDGIIGSNADRVLRHAPCSVLVA